VSRDTKALGDLAPAPTAMPGIMNQDDRAAAARLTALGWRLREGFSTGHGECRAEDKGAPIKGHDRNNIRNA
jgi:hypothetical protein